MTAQDGGGRYRGSLVLVVGGGTGIGRAAAQRLAAEGARVGVDVRSTTSVTEALARFAARSDALDALLHVAGGDMAYGAFEEVGDEIWQAMLELNLLGPVRMIRAALPRLRASRRGPAVAVVSSINASLTLGSVPYSAAKAGLAPLIGNLADELGPQGIRINAVAPGTIRTRVWDDQGGPDRLAHLYPLGRVGEPTDVAAALAFLCSSDAAWITGQVLPVDGGLSVRRIPLE